MVGLSCLDNCISTYIYRSINSKLVAIRTKPLWWWKKWMSKRLAGDGNLCRTLENDETIINCIFISLDKDNKIFFWYNNCITNLFLWWWYFHPNFLCHLPNQNHFRNLRLLQNLRCLLQIRRYLLLLQNRHYHFLSCQRCGRMGRYQERSLQSCRGGRSRCRHGYRSRCRQECTALRYH